MSEPAQRRKSPDGGHFYEHPTRIEPDPDNHGTDGTPWIRPARYISVTTALGVISKEALVFWSAKKAAERAMANLPQLITAAFVEDCGRAYARTDPQPCGVCIACVRRWVSLFHVGEKERRAREGSAAHDVFERWCKTDVWSYTPALTGDADVDQYVPTAEQMAPYIAAMVAFVADYGVVTADVVVTECTVYHHGLMYAGTLDLILDVHPRTKRSAEFCARVGLAGGVEPGAPVRVLVDLKSREGEDAQLYDENPLQLTAYRFAETMMPKASLRPGPDLEIDMLATDGAAILQVRPDGYTFRPVLTGGDSRKAFEAALTMARWRNVWGDYSTQVQAFPLPDGWKWKPPAPPAEAQPAELLAEQAEAPPKPVRKRAPAKKAAPAADSPAEPKERPRFKRTAPGAGAAVGGSGGATMANIASWPRGGSNADTLDDGTPIPF